MSGEGKSIGISIHIKDMTMPRKEECQRAPSIEDKVRERIENIDSGSGCLQDFLVLKKLQETLRNKKPCTPRIQNLMDMIEPVMRKFGYYF
jgi:hypothetical protein